MPGSRASSRAWGGPVAGRERLDEIFILAAAQHDIGWLPWEAAPTRDPATGRPHSFVALPREAHTALWSAGVATAEACYGPHVALLISLHGLAIYALTPDEARAPDDLAAVRRFRAEQEAVQARLRAAVAATAAEIADQSAILLALDLISLVVCGTMGRAPRRTRPCRSPAAACRSRSPSRTRAGIASRSIRGRSGTRA